ncbi:MAG: PKD domain-containing protein [Burkholderiales bacterium]|nr:PKD domain-containing protein [Burkholderiales bacterium]
MNAPSQAEPGVALALSSDLGEGRTGLSFSWDFGDGTGATQARPAHSYAAPGRYTVTLSVSNSAGQRITAQAGVQVGRFAMVRDLQCTGAANTGWCWQAPQPNGDAVLDVFFLDRNRGWATAQAGQLWSSQDGGQTWQRLPDVPDGTLTRVAFADTRNGWALSSRRGLLARTRDGGQTWQTVVTPRAAIETTTYSDFDRLWVLGPDTVMARITVFNPRTSARGSFAWITTDGGANWRLSAVAPDQVQPGGTLWEPAGWIYNGTRPGYSTDLGLTRIDVPGLPRYVYVSEGAALDIWYHGSNNTSSTGNTLHHSRDGGVTVEQWTVSLPADSGATALGSLTLSAQGTGWSVSGSTVLRTEDGAKTWSTVVVPAQAGQRVQPTALDPDSLWAMVGGQLQLTEDGGRTWRALANPDDSSSGYTLQREPGGALRLTSLSAHYRSVDGGRHWWPAPGSLREDLAQTNFVGLVMADAQRGIALDDRGTWFDTADGGRQWLRRAGEALVCNGASGSLQFTGGGQGWALVHGCLLRSTDGGKTWAPAPRPQAMASLSVLRFRGALRGWALSTDGQAFATADGGQTWQATESKESVWPVASADGSTLWRIEPQDSSRLSRSSDGGTTWVPMPVPAGSELRGLWFIDARTGWLVGEGGLVLATTDGGQTWQRQDSGSSATLHTVHALDAATVWVAGGRGTVLATATGGR